MLILPIIIFWVSFRHLHKFYGQLSQFYFKEQTAKHIIMIDDWE